ncbi:MAG TPA: TatD family hydrolase [Candidatus Saccharimonadales bacterium]|nr:TatD family hydrolase [Candidatus Saccharimonadales bacterium]
MFTNLVDTHCHIHTASSKIDSHTVKKWHEAGEKSAEELLKSAKAGGVDKLICVGTDYEDSIDAVNFVQAREGCWSAVGVHPHEAKEFFKEYKDLSEFDKLIKKPKVAAIGEVGLDYYYEHSPRKEQQKLLEMFLDLAQKHNLPVIFHIREAFDDFWPILANFTKIRGVLHSFTDSEKNLEKAMERRLLVGLNGIMTFTKDQSQLQTAKKIPLESLLLETDAPYLAPKPLRGKICKPEHVRYTYEFLSRLRGEDEEEFINTVSANVKRLFGV